MKQDGITAREVLDAVERWATGQTLLRELGDVFDDSNRRLDGLLVPHDSGARCMRESRRRTDRPEKHIASIDGGEVTVPGKEYIVFFDRPALYGVEVKVTRPDFHRGIITCQYAAYAEKVAGLYIATPKGVCTTEEVPRPHGHIVVSRPRGKDYISARCKRHPEFRSMEYPVSVVWRLLFRLRQDWLRNE